MTHPTFPSTPHFNCFSSVHIGSVYRPTLGVTAEDFMTRTVNALLTFPSFQTSVSSAAFCPVITVRILIALVQSPVADFKDYTHKCEQESNPLVSIAYSCVSVFSISAICRVELTYKPQIGVYC